MFASHYARHLFRKPLKAKNLGSYSIYLVLAIISFTAYRRGGNSQSPTPVNTSSKEPTYLYQTFLSLDTPCTHGYKQYSCYSSVISFAKQRQQQRYIVLLIVTNDIRHLVLNWCLSAQNIHLENYILVAFDSASFLFFSNLRAPVVKVSRASTPTSRSEIWIHRTLVAYVLLLDGFHVLISDADAIAVRSPFHALISNSFYDNFDIIASPSNFPNPFRGELPQECHAQLVPQWLYQPCMGWILTRSNANTTSFFSQLFIPNVLKYADDQIGLACALRHAQQSRSARYSWSSTQNIVMHFTNPSLTMAMLPAARYVRNCTRFKQEKQTNYGIWKFDLNKVAMFHCKGGDKRANAENNGVWYLREHWSEVSLSDSSSFDVYLRKIRRRKDLKKDR